MVSHDAYMCSSRGTYSRANVRIQSATPRFRGCMYSIVYVVFIHDIYRVCISCSVVPIIMSTCTTTVIVATKVEALVP